MLVQTTHHKAYCAPIDLKKDADLIDYTTINHDLRKLASKAKHMGFISDSQICFIMQD